MRLFVGNLPFATTEEYLREFFEESGQVVEDLMIVKDKKTGRSRGFAFITLADGDDIKKVTERFDGQSFMGQRLTVNEAVTKEPPRWENPPGRPRKR